MKFRILVPLALYAIFALSACGGGGGGESNPNVISYSGSTSEANVSDTNADKLAVSGTAGTGQSIADQSAQGAVFRPSPDSAFIERFAGIIKTQLTTANRTANAPVPDVCNPGSVDQTVSQDGTQFTMRFTDCVLIEGNGEVINGVVDVTILDQQTFDFRMHFRGVTVTINGELYIINSTMTCQGTGCTWSSDFTGPDGRTYRVEDVVIVSSANSYSITARVYDPEHGYIAIDGSNITFGNCAGGVPESGTMTLSGASGTTASVVFDSCSSFTVTVNGGVSNTYNWADYLI